MKFYFLFVCFLSTVIPMFAQEEMPASPAQSPVTPAQQEQTLFTRAKLRGGWIGSSFSNSKVGDYNGYGAGGSLGLVFNSFSVGLYGQGESFDGFQRDNRNYAFTMGHGGLYLGYSYPTKKALHLMGSLKIGGGGVGMARRHHDWDWELEEEDFGDAIFVILPEVGLELNVTHWMRMSATAGYRVVNGFRGIPELNKNDLNAPIFGLNFRFGWFGHKG